ncbi:MAG: hypothetical protein NZ553_20035 [Caldilinea sp.]|nr:hypothetical protein [Caldilinea sp.]MDW8442775.1 hypothetical protein [Caldilineaceae bacterium]
MRGNGAQHDDPNNRFKQGAEEDFDLLEEDEGKRARETARQRARRRRYRPKYSKPPRRPASEREGAFNALMWILDGVTGLLEELQHNDLGLPEEFWVHAYAARREGLLALRAILDAWIDEDASPAQSSPSPERPKRGGINIDF